MVEPVPLPISETEKIRGKKLIQKFECVRCHEIAGLERPVLDKDCVRCHQAIESGEFEEEKSVLEEWRENLHSLPHTPSLTQAAAYLRPSWIVEFIQKPHDLRPNLKATMPRLTITAADAKSIVNFLRSNVHESSGDERTEVAYTNSDIQNGAAVLKEKKCGTCHQFSGTEILSDAIGDPKAAPFALALDLAYTRDRMTPKILRRWLENPKSLKPDTIMPVYPFTKVERDGLVAVILGAKITRPPRMVPKRLEILKRPVYFDEVDEKVFKRVCWHCHSNPDFADGDGGPGNTGGFGYKGIGLSFASYEEMVSGYLGKDGKYHSIFEKKNGVSILLNTLLKRQKEESGEFDDETLGMPLGFPSISPENIQLVETWIAQGYPE